ncbi:PAS domain-containing protein [Roseobacteraceae bacterium S113]
MDNFESDTTPTTAADVVQLPKGFKGPTQSNPHAQIEAYWHALRGTQLVPARSDVDPRGIEMALSFAFVAERIAPGHARMRIAGTHLSDVMGMEVRGMPLSALFEPTSRDRLRAALRCVFDDPSIYKLGLVSEARLGKPRLTASMALFPLRNDMGDISRVLGCFQAEGTLGRAPRRFEILRSDRQSLSTQEDRFASRLSAIEPEDEAPKAVGFAEEQQEFTSTAVPYLRVVTDNS